MADYEKYEDQLNAEYYHTFKEIEVYFKASDLLDSEMEESMNDILDMFLMAQSEGKPLKKVIGKDTESFCRNYKKGMWKFSGIKEAIRYGCEWLAAAAICIIFTVILSYYDGRIHDVWRDKADISSMLIYFLPFSIGGLIDKYIIKKKIFKNCITRENHIERKGWIAILILGFLLIWLLEKYNIQIYASLCDSLFILVIMAAVIVTIYVIIKMIYEFQISKRIH